MLRDFSSRQRAPLFRAALQGRRVGGEKWVRAGRCSVKSCTLLSGHRLCFSPHRRPRWIPLARTSFFCLLFLRSVSILAARVLPLLLPAAPSFLTVRQALSMVLIYLADTVISILFCVTNRVTSAMTIIVPKDALLITFEIGVSFQHFFRRPDFSHCCAFISHCSGTGAVA